MPGNISQYQVVIAGQIIAASLWNGMETNIIDNGLIPAGIDDYSATDGEMQTQTDPYPGGSTSRPTSLQGEIERLRFQHKNITGKTYWYQDPDTTLAAAATDIDALEARFPVVHADIATAAVNDSQIIDVNANKILGQIATAQIADQAINASKLATSVAGAGLSGGAGTDLSVNVDSSTIIISGDTLSAVPATLGLKSIQSITPTDVLIASGDSTGFSDTTITSVNTAKAVAIVTSLTVVSDTSSNHLVPMVTAAFTSATNLRIRLNTMQNIAGGGNTYRTAVVVLEFN